MKSGGCDTIDRLHAPLSCSSCSVSRHLVAYPPLRCLTSLTCCPCSLFSISLAEITVAVDEQKKAARIAIKLLSTAGTGFFYTASKNVRTATGKLALKKVRKVYLPEARQGRRRGGQHRTVETWLKISRFPSALPETTLSQT